MRGDRCGWFAMFFNVLARKLVQVRTLSQADLFCFLFGVFDLPTVAQHSPDHPEHSDANGSGAVYKRGPVFRIVSDLEKLSDLFFFWIREHDWNVEIL